MSTIEWATIFNEKIVEDEIKQYQIILANLNATTDNETLKDSPLHCQKKINIFTEARQT